MGWEAEDFTAARQCLAVASENFVINLLVLAPFYRAPGVVEQLKMDGIPVG